MSYATGKHALAMCPRCGFQVRYKTLVQEWTGRWVCPECFDPKHPQLDPTPVPADAIALDHPQPDRDDMDTGDEVQLYTIINPTHGDRQAGDG